LPRPRRGSPGPFLLQAGRSPGCPVPAARSAPGLPGGRSGPSARSQFAVGPPVRPQRSVWPVPE